MAEEQKEIESNLKAELFSPEERIVLGALAQIGEEGSRDMVEPVLELLARTNSEEIQQIVLSQLSQLKISDVEEIFVEKILNDEFLDFRQQLVFCMWNSGMNPVNHLHVFAKLAVEGDYMMALEVLTLVENMEGPFDHESLTDALSDASIYISENTMEEPKMELIKGIYEILYVFQEEE